MKVSLTKSKRGDTRLIGHASIDENGKAKNGKAGDQTGKEVCTRQWYNKNWTVMLRCTSLDKAEKMARACEAGCKNPYIGYDQNQRNTLRSAAQIYNWDLGAIKTYCETDCSAFMTVCAECAGIKVPYNGSNAPTTSTMESAFKATGLFKAYKDKKYLTGTQYLRRGDILVQAGHHTVMVLEDGENETMYPETGLNDRGSWVLLIQQRLATKGYDVGIIDAIYGGRTYAAVKKFQRDVFDDPTEWDGIVGAKTWAKLMQ